MADDRLLITSRYTFPCVTCTPMPDFKLVSYTVNNRHSDNMDYIKEVDVNCIVH